MPQQEKASLTLQERSFQAFSTPASEDTVFYTPMGFMRDTARITPSAGQIEQQNDLRRQEVMRRLLYTTPPMVDTFNLREGEEVAMSLRSLNENGETAGDPYFYAVRWNKERDRPDSVRDITEAFYTRCHEQGLDTFEREGSAQKEGQAGSGGSPEIG
jgi:hypothetical protein